MQQKSFTPRRPLLLRLFLSTALFALAVVLGCNPFLTFAPSEACNKDLPKVDSGKYPIRRGCLTFTHVLKKMYAVQLKNQQFFYCTSFDNCNLDIVDIPQTQQTSINDKENETALFAFPPEHMLAGKPTLDNLFTVCTDMFKGKSPACCWNSSNNNALDNCWILFRVNFKRGVRAVCERWFKDESPPPSGCAKTD